MNNFMYIECDVPEGIGLREWRRELPSKGRRRLHFPRLHLIR